MKLDYARLDPELAAALEQMPLSFAGITPENVHVVREMMAAMRVPVPTDVAMEQQSVPTADGEVAVYIYHRNPSSPQPALLWIHGGGYIVGSAEEDRARIIAENLDCTVVSVVYRMAPEHPFPAGPEDCYSSLLWMVEHAQTLKIDTSRLAIGGASAGAGMAAGVALMNRDRGGPALALQLLMYPMIDNLHDTPSGQYTNHPVWDQGTSFSAWEMYLDGTPGLDASPYAAASRATDLSGLPPAYICVGTEDLFRDEDIDYARRLIDAGVPCELAVFPGMYHGGDMLVPLARISRRLNAYFLSALSHGLGLS